jgi:hypothetical protein
MQQASQQTVVTASVAITLITDIVQHVSGQEYTDMLRGSVVSRNVLGQMVAASLARRMSHITSQPVKVAK